MSPRLSFETSYPHVVFVGCLWCLR